MMAKILYILSTEVVLTILFLIMGLYKQGGFRNVVISILKGWVERAFLCYGLLLDIPLVLILFSALKLGTRFQDSKSSKDDEDSKDKGSSKVSNDQFLIGNLLSVAAAIFYTWLLVH
jgi:hypothetical protein